VKRQWEREDWALRRCEAMTLLDTPALNRLRASSERDGIREEHVGGKVQGSGLVEGVT
jgi:hypothetical protein